MRNLWLANQLFWGQWHGNPALKRPQPESQIQFSFSCKERNCSVAREDLVQWCCRTRYLFVHIINRIISGIQLYNGYCIYRGDMCQSRDPQPPQKNLGCQAIKDSKCELSYHSEKPHVVSSSNKHVKPQENWLLQANTTLGTSFS